MKNIRITPGGKITLDTTKIESIQNELKKKFHARVGVIAGKSQMMRPAPVSGETREEYTSRIKKWIKQNRKGEDAAEVTNADLAAIHEFGTDDIPARSWLRMPLLTFMPNVYRTVGQKLVDMATKENIVDVYKGLGIRAEAIIQKAFESRGFGKWAPNAPETIRQKGSDAPLIDTAEFRKSITSEVVVE